MKRLLVCFILLTILLTSCTPLVIKITVGGQPGNAAPPATQQADGAQGAGAQSADDAQAGQDPSGDTALANAEATPAATAGAAVSGADNTTGKAGDTSALAAESPTGLPTPTGVPADAPAADGKSICTSSEQSSGAFTVKLCLKVAPGALSGVAPIGASVSVTGQDAQVQRLVFYLNGQYLLTMFHSPFTFKLPTTRWPDGSYALAVQAQMRNGFLTAKSGETVTFQNGTVAEQASQPTFTPATGTTPAAGQPFVVMATGDGAGGEPNETKVVDMIAATNPNLLLYLGDVYESGSPAEFYNWYGVDGSFYDRFRAITNPTVGNHEYLYNKAASGYFTYWNNIPNYYSFNAGGWHFISLNSNYNRIGVEKGSQQYTWLQHDLAANAGSCAIVYYHQPLFNIGPEGPETQMQDIWALLVENHVSIVLNGHDHDYQRWVPLDSSGNPSPNGVTEFVAGGGGHGVQKTNGTDDRVAYATSKNPDALGALKLELSPSGASFSYMSITGTVLDSGTIQCKK